MSLLDKASLIVTPNAYKESKLYSVVPSSGAGDMTVVRATTATRVNSAGLIEVVPRNLFTYSEQIDNADWAKQGISTTQNQAISPNGTMTAELLDDGTAASTQHWIFQNPSLLNGTTYTISFYAKYISRKFMAVNIFNGLASQYVYYNIQDGLISGSTGDVTASITSVDNNWFRITYTRPMATSGSAPNFRIGFADDTPNITYTGSNKQAYVWGFQIENFATATEYFPTTTRLNIPRIDYTNGSCPSLLVEPQRTNVVNYSEEFNNAYWNKLETTVTANTTNSPSGILNADSLIESTSNGRHMIWKPFTSVIGTSYTLSVFCKQNTRRYANINFKTTTTASPRFSALFDLQTGTNVSTSSVGSPTGTSFSIVPYANGWYKISITMNAASISTELEISASNTSTPTLSEGSPSYLGDGTSGIYLWGAQLEAGAYATSYIPTVASTVTRNADVISKTGISSLIDSQQGVLFVDLQFFTGLGGIRSIHISNGSNNNRIGFYGHPSIANRIDFAISNGGTTTDINFNGVTLTNRNKVLIRYSGTTFTGFVNGVKSSNQTFTPFAANFLNRIGLDYGEDILRYEGRINSIQLYKTALTDAECIALTTL